MHRTIRDEHDEAERLRLYVKNLHPQSKEAIATTERIAALDARLVDRRAEHARVSADASAWAQRAAPVKDLVNGILREIGLGAGDLAIDFVDFDIQVGGVTRGEFQ